MPARQSTPLEITDVSGYPGHADQVFSPRDEEELAALLVRASEERIPVTTMGAMTGLAGGAAPQGGWGVTMARFRRLEIQAGRARVGAGVLLKEVQAAAAAAAQFYAPDPTENTSSIGGNIAANASGSRSFLYGATRRHVLAVQVAFMDGRIVEYRHGQKLDFDVPQIPLPQTTKHSAGYRLTPRMDFADLFVGSEGTLGIVTEAELQLLPAPNRIMAGVVFFPSEETAIDAVERWRPAPGLRMLEYLDRASLQMMDEHFNAAVIVEQEGEIDLDMNGALENDSWFATSPADRERFRRFRHGLGERANLRIRQGGYMKLGTDYAVPRDRARQVLELYRGTLDRDLKLPYVIYGHIGDAHLHINTFPSSKPEFDRAKGVLDGLAYPIVAMGGTVGAEHGLGKRKAHLLSVQYKPDTIEAMRAVKRRFDPHWLLGQGNLFGERNSV
ncbi:MAG: FAD-binding oxidoreductase [Bryobacterales bacterium]|nr:FAD-binding oxidoreductase [Bryobacterales bacterium]MBV9399525.1 FAD-binding oxidoreductase [Bryobacterales bacterium]